MREKRVKKREDVRCCLCTFFILLVCVCVSSVEVLTTRLRFLTCLSLSRFWEVKSKRLKWIRFEKSWTQLKVSREVWDLRTFVAGRIYFALLYITNKLVWFSLHFHCLVASHWETNYKLIDRQPRLITGNTWFESIVIFITYMCVFSFKILGLFRNQMILTHSLFVIFVYSNVCSFVYWRWWSAFFSVEFYECDKQSFAKYEFLLDNPRLVS